MASHTWILLCCILFSALLNVKGLDFTIARTPGEKYCGHLQCVSTINDANSVVSWRLTIYDVSVPNRRYKLTDISTDQPNLYSDPTRTDFNATGTISSSSVQTFVDLSRNVDCVNRYFQCDLEVVNSRGQRSVVSKTVSPPEEDPDCTCEAVTAQFSEYFNRADEIQRDITRLRQSNTELAVDISELEDSYSVNDKTVVSLKRTAANLQSGIVTLEDNDRDAERQLAGLRHDNEFYSRQLSDLEASDRAQQLSIVALRESDEAQKATLADNRQSDRETQAILNALKRNDTVIEGNVNELKRNDKTIADTGNELTHIFRVFLEETNDLSRKDAEAQDNINDRQAADNAQAAAIASLRNDFDAQRVSINELTAEFASEQAAIVSLQEADASLLSRIVILEQSDEAISENIAVLDINYDSLASTIKNLRVKDNADRILIGELERRDAELDKSIDDLENKAGETRGNIGILRQKDEFIWAEIEALTAVNAALDATVDAQVANLTALQLQFLALIDEHARLNADLVRRQNDVNDLELFLKSAAVTTVTTTTSKLITVEDCRVGATHSSDEYEVVVHDGVRALCDMKTDRGGWVIVERRRTGSLSFKRTYEEYETGFGTTQDDYFIGTRELHTLTSGGWTVARITITTEERSYYAEYSSFSVGDRSSNYRLSVSGYRGDAEDFLVSGAQFSAYDRDNDNDAGNCAEVDHGGWWYNGCDVTVNLHGDWGLAGPGGATYRGKPIISSVFEVRIPIE